MAKNYDVLANSVVELIGGKDNVRSLPTASHGCASM